MNLSPEKKIAGVLAPLFGLRGENDLGIGDVAVLREFIDWAAEIGFKLVQLLPINEIGGDNSPYNAISAMAIEPTTLHLAPGSPEDLTREDFDAALTDVDVAKLRHGHVRYPRVKKLKRRLLEKAFGNFRAGAADDRQSLFHNFCKRETSWLNHYALFRALMEQNHASEAWDKWPTSQRSIDSARAWLDQQSTEKQNEFREHEDFFRYVQWIAHDQWSAVRSHA
jgi:4-alpha-glucanotransferase